MDDQKFMLAALELARSGLGTTSPNPMVGAVVVKDGKIIGRGYHEAPGKAHAEVNAIDDAGEAARDATLYVTLEPCNHTGRTPPCTQKILAAGIRRLVVAMRDPNPHVKGGGNETLERRGVAVVSGVCEDLARKLNEAYIKFVQTQEPFVTVKCAATLDGRLATRTGDSKWISGPASRAFVHQLRHAVDAIMVGVETVKRDDPALTTRMRGKIGKDPRRIILDSRLSIPEDAKILSLDSPADTVIVSGESIPEDKRARIEGPGVKVVPFQINERGVDLAALVRELGKWGVMHLLIEGGAGVIASAFSARVVDKFLIFLAPKILGGDDGVPVCRGPGPERMSDSIAVHPIDVRRFDDDVMIEGYIRKPGRKV
jgi:diaminohydroxyphosphoribosylaminopyrimidine deaminase/5-amino-6-(5-phosphoribosylamino)uracil reductase